MSYDKKNLEKVLKIMLIKLNEESSKMFIELYNDVPDISLKKMFSIYHKEFNDLFEYLNSRLTTGRFTAEESRELLKLIRDIESLKENLEETHLAFDIDKKYLENILKCKTFLKSSGGSPIPIDFTRISIIYIRPIFFLKTQIDLRNRQANENYKIKLIGCGSYADVFKYKDETYNKYFAIKRAKTDLTSEELERFKIEFEEIKKLKSPYIIDVYTFDTDKNQYIMEYMDMTLEKYISENNNKLDTNKRIGIVAQIFKAFEYIHSKEILHRDISTKNILIKKYEDVNVVKISDFGLVKLLDSNLTKQSTKIKGFFNDHEDLQKVGFNNYNIKHETYALTKLVYFVMTGKISINGYDKTQFNNFVSNGITDNLNKRYSSVRELAKAFYSAINPNTNNTYR